MQLGMIITQTDPETVFNALRLALYSLEQGDKVLIFLSGGGVEIDLIEDPKFDVKAQAQGSPGCRRPVPRLRGMPEATEF